MASDLEERVDRTVAANVIVFRESKVVVLIRGGHNFVGYGQIGTTTTVREGDTVRDAAVRSLQALKIMSQNLAFRSRFNYDGPEGKMNVELFTCSYKGEIVPDKAEVESILLADPSQLEGGIDGKIEVGGKIVLLTPLSRASWKQYRDSYRRHER